MKKFAIVCAVVSAQLLLKSPATAQGTIFLSNLGQAPVGNGAVGIDSWLAQPFGTGTNATGYVLNSVQLLMNPGVGSPSGFTAAIYSSPGNDPPVTLLGSLAGSDPAAGGVFS